MKQIIKNGLFLLIIGACLTSCSNQSQTAKELLKDSDKRDEIMTTISTDHQLMDHMMDHMMKNDQAMQMMMSNQKMMSQMMQGEHAMGMMGNMMQKDTAMSRMIGEMMNGYGMGDKTMMGENKGSHSNHH